MVEIFLPTTAETGSTQLRVAAPSMCTVQAPHKAMPQPNLVPVRLRLSRSTQSSGVSSAASVVSSLPLTFSFIIARLRRLKVQNSQHYPTIAAMTELNHEQDLLKLA